MMNYEIFKEVFKEKLTGYLPDEFKDYKAVEHKVFKVNCEKDAINLFPVGKGNGSGGSPTIYVENFYKMYQQGESLDDVIRHAVETITKGFQKIPETLKSENMDMDRLKGRVVATLVNTVQNEEYLKRIPHREFLDLSIMYRCVISADENGMGSAVITNEMAMNMGMNEAQLYEAAMKNTPEILPVCIKPMDEIICDMIMGEDIDAEDEISKEEIMEMLSEVKGEAKGTDMYVMTNNERLNGAAEILFPENLERLSSMFDSDIYIIPSSIHEIIALSADGKDVNVLQKMVNEVNINEVSLEERLSNEVYHYDRNTRELTIASDAPNKRLDGKAIAEPFHYDAPDRAL